MGKHLYLKVFLFLLVSVIISVIFFGVYGFRIDSVNFLLYIAFIILILPFLFYKDLYHPLIVYSLFQSLILIDLFNKSLENPTYLRYLYTSSIEAETFLSLSIVLWSVWYLLLLLGFFVAKKVKIWDRKSQTNIILNFNTRVKSPTTIAVIFILVGFSSFLYAVFVINTGFISLLDSMMNRVETYKGLNYVLYFTQLGVIGSILLLFKDHKKSSIIIFLLFLVMISFYGSRGTVLNLFITYILAYNYKINKISYIKLFPMGILGMIFAKLYGTQRFSGKFSLSDSFIGLTDQIKYAASQKASGDIIPSLIGGIKKNVIDFQLGKDFFNILYAPIPRLIWENKPKIDETGIIGDLLMGDNSWGLPAGSYGWVYLNFSWIGILILGILTGFIAAKIYKFAMTQIRRNTDYLFIFYILTVTSLMDIFTTSGQINIFYSLFIIVLIKLFDNLINIFKNGKPNLLGKFNNV